MNSALRHLLLVASLLATSGCILPLMTAAPQSATTVGKGKAGGTLWADFPDINLVSTSGNAVSEAPISPFPNGTLEGAYGLSDDFDLELGIEGMLYLYFLPLPTGVHLGGRYQFLDTPTWKGAVAARGGYAAFRASSSNSSGSGVTDIKAANFGATMVVQLASVPVFKPGLAISAWPSYVWYSNTAPSLPRESLAFGTVATSATLNFTLDFGTFELTPFLGCSVFYTPRLPTVVPVVQGGLAFAVRHDKDAAREREAALRSVQPAPAPTPVEQPPMSPPPQPPPTGSEVPPPPPPPPPEPPPAL